MIVDDGCTRVLGNGDPVELLIEAFDLAFVRLRSWVRESLDTIERITRDTSEMIREFEKALGRDQEQERRRGYALFAPCTLTSSRDDVPPPTRSATPVPIATWKRLTTAREPRRSTASGWHAPRPRR